MCFSRSNEITVLNRISIISFSKAASAVIRRLGILAKCVPFVFSNCCFGYDMFWRCRWKLPPKHFQLLPAGCLYNITMSCNTQLLDSPEQVASNRTLKIPPNYRPAPRAASIPTFRVDLSLPPSDRYVELATAFAPHLRGIGGILDNVLKSRVRFVAFRGIIKYLARNALRHVHLPEEMEELRSIANASGAELHLLVVLNVLLDSLMGCTSGGVLAATTEGKAGMMHFRTLDWDMDRLRDLLVVLEFVRSNSKEPEKVVGRSITYAGFVGVLTGVR